LRTTTWTRREEWPHQPGRRARPAYSDWSVPTLITTRADYRNHRPKEECAACATVPRLIAELRVRSESEPDTSHGRVFSAGAPYGSWCPAPVRLPRSSGSLYAQPHASGPQPTASPISSVRQKVTSGGEVTPAACKTGPMSGWASLKKR
jgi:hypothetical protein